MHHWRTAGIATKLRRTSDAREEEGARRELSTTSTLTRGERLQNRRSVRDPTVNSPAACPRSTQFVTDEGNDGWYEHDYQWSQGQLVILRKNE